VFDVIAVEPAVESGISYTLAVHWGGRRPGWRRGADERAGETAVVCGKRMAGIARRSGCCRNFFRDRRVRLRGSVAGYGRLATRGILHGMFRKRRAPLERLSMDCTVSVSGGSDRGRQEAPIFMGVRGSETPSACVIRSITDEIDRDTAHRNERSPGTHTFGGWQRISRRRRW